MTITITKGKLVRWIATAVILFCSTGQAVDVPGTVNAAIAQREFMADFTGYDDYSLLDVYRWRKGFYGVVMLCPAGFHETLVFDCRDGKREIVYHDAYIPRKDKRAEMRKNSILVRDAVRLARNATALADGA
jgi:hypothetical protein